MRMHPCVIKLTQLEENSLGFKEQIGDCIKTFNYQLYLHIAKLYPITDILVKIKETC